MVWDMRRIRRVESFYDNCTMSVRLELLGKGC
jgi:hypothetical protein